MLLLNCIIMNNVFKAFLYFNYCRVFFIRNVFTLHAYSRKRNIKSRCFFYCFFHCYTGYFCRHRDQNPRYVILLNYFAKLVCYFLLFCCSPVHSDCACNCASLRCVPFLSPCCFPHHCFHMYGSLAIMAVPRSVNDFNADSHLQLSRLISMRI